MKSLLLLLLALPGLVAAYEPLRPMSACLDPARARSWHLIDSDEILVDAGRQRFHLALEPSCPELAYTDSVGFRPGTGVGRICGNAGDTVVAPRRTPIGIRCQIAKVTPLTKEQFSARIKGEEKLKGVVEVPEKDEPQR